MWVREHLASTLTYLRLCEYPVLDGLDNVREVSAERADFRLRTCTVAARKGLDGTRLLPSIPVFMFVMLCLTASDH